MLGAILAYRLGIPLVASWHTNVHEFGGRRLAKVLANAPARLRSAAVGMAERRSLDLAIRFYKLARVIFAPNPELCDLLETRCDRPVFPMFRGIDCDLYTPTRRMRTSNRFVVGYVGRISAEKNVRMLSVVQQLLRRRGRNDIEFHIVGEGSERAWLQEHLCAAQFQGVLKGEALANAYAQMDVLLFPSETDTFGNVVLEAAASGVPSVVSVHGGPKYLVQDCVTGFHAEGAEQFADAIDELASSPDCRKAMGAAARAAAMSRSWEAVFEGIYGHYREGMAQGSLRASTPNKHISTRKTFRTTTVS
jgi:glycosyltransferase involved in cell wall biosynthesis